MNCHVKFIIIFKENILNSTSQKAWPQHKTIENYAVALHFLS